MEHDDPYVAGRLIAGDNPAIREDFIGGLSASAICTKYRIHERYSLSGARSMQAIYEALSVLLSDEDIIGVAGQVQRARKKLNTRSSKKPRRPPIILSRGHRRNFIDLCNNPAYQHASGPHRGCPDYRKIQEELGQKGVSVGIYSLQRRWSYFRKKG
ncbi:MAG: hypothetical protein HY518_04890 [Candidatus Aenigmarchaeota archaeon]|nr:hypothetical protein [Candidatus Aenigmarchaeota archaeon]